MLTVCGVDCQKSCKSFNNGCAGCNQLMGAVPWVSFIGFCMSDSYLCKGEEIFYLRRVCKDSMLHLANRHPKS